MEKCTNGENHVFMNTWGSLRQHGYCGLCSCTRSVTPQELLEALRDNQCTVDNDLFRLVMRYMQQ